MTSISPDHKKTGTSYSYVGPDKKLTDPIYSKTDKVNRYTDNAKSQKGGLSQLEIEIAVSYIKKSAFLQSEWVKALTDGAILAAEQVQDQRISKLEQGPEVQVSDVLIDVLIVLALDSTVAGAVLSGITKSVMTRLLQSSSVFFSLPESVLSVEGTVISRLFRDKATISTAKKIAKDFLAHPEQKLLLYGTWINELYKGSSSMEKNLVAGAKAVNNYRKKPPKEAPTLSVTDTPGVAVLSAAQRYASQQQYAIFLEHSMYEFAVRAGLLTKEDIIEILNPEINEKDAEQGMAMSREYYKLLYEAAIWAKLLRLDTTQPVFYLHGFFPAKAGLRDIPNFLLDYWLKRFRNPASGKIFDEENYDQVQKVLNLHKYLINIGNRIKLTQQNVAADAMRIILPLILKDKIEEPKREK
jgi:hypothetical protein